MADRRAFQGLHGNIYKLSDRAMKDSDYSSSDHVKIIKSDGKVFYIPIHDWLKLAKIISTSIYRRQTLIALSEIDPTEGDKRKRLPR
jgi:hypothetical protein